MAIFAMRFLLIAVPSSSDHPSRIFFRRHRLKVRGIHARSLKACVIERQFTRDGSVHQAVDDAVHALIPFRKNPAELWVSLAVFPTFPQPAPRFDHLNSPSDGLRYLIHVW
jgi:hypothetical protein